MQQTTGNAVIPLSFACTNPILPLPLTLNILLHPPAPTINLICTRSTYPKNVTPTPKLRHSPTPGFRYFFPIHLLILISPTSLMTPHLPLILFIDDSSQHLLVLHPYSI